MVVQISSSGIVLDDPQREWIERRLRLALGRFVARIRCVTANISSSEETRSVAIRKCRLRVILLPDREIVLDVIDSSLETAIANVSDRAARSIARALDSAR